jgi:glycosyltransferase involved in cell wall biosynthesis
MSINKRFNTFLSFYYKNPFTLFRNLYFKLRSYLYVEKYDLIIIDNIFPNEISAFRYEEFLHILTSFDKICVFSGFQNINHEFEKNFKFNAEFNKKYPHLKRKLKHFEFHRKVKARLGYSLFLDNTSFYIEYYKKNNIPFVFTLYPGAGFFLDQEETNTKLNRLMSNNLFKGVITTQKISAEYLIKNRFCDPSLINFIFGAVISNVFFNAPEYRKMKKKEDPLHIIFVANKQMSGAYDKGFDLFVNVIKRIYSSNIKAFFDVVGPYSNDDIMNQGIDHIIRFHGFLKSADLVHLYQEIDIILSPNRAFVLRPGAFDGFPTAAVTEAMLCGVTAIVSDPLSQNLHFSNNEDILFTNNDAEQIYNILLELNENRKKLYKIGIKGKEMSKNIYSFESQVQPRIEYLNKLTFLE